MIKKSICGPYNLQLDKEDKIWNEGIQWIIFLGIPIILQYPKVLSIEMIEILLTQGYIIRILILLGEQFNEKGVKNKKGKLYFWFY